MQPIKPIIFVIFLLRFAVVSAETADLQIALDFENIDNGVIYGQFGRFTLTVTNNGPETAGTNSTSDFPIFTFSSIITIGEDDFLEISIMQDFSITQNCLFRRIIAEPPPGGVGGVAYTINVPELPANSSATCHGLYRISFKQGVRTIEWQVISTLQDTDPDMSNNSQDIVFRIRPEIVPVNNIWGLTTLLLLVVLMVKRKINLNCRVQ